MLFFLPFLEDFELRFLRLLREDFEPVFDFDLDVLLFFDDDLRRFDELLRFLADALADAPAPEEAATATVAAVFNESSDA